MSVRDGRDFEFFLDRLSDLYLRKEGGMGIRANGHLEGSVHGRDLWIPSLKEVEVQGNE